MTDRPRVVMRVIASMRSCAWTVGAEHVRGRSKRVERAALVVARLEQQSAIEVRACEEHRWRRGTRRDHTSERQEGLV